MENDNEVQRLNKFINNRLVNSLPAVFAKFSVEEFVHENQLDDNVHEAEEFAEPVTNCVQFVSLKLLQQKFVSASMT